MSEAKDAPVQLGPTKALVKGRRFTESPRWHDGRLFFVDMHVGKVLSIVPGAESEPKTEVEINDDFVSGLGWDTDNRLIIVSMRKRKLYRREHSGELTEFADVSDVCAFNINDMCVDKKGRCYVGGFGYNVDVGDPPVATGIALVQPDGTVSAQAKDLLIFPNGIVISEDGKTLIVAETFAGRISAFDINEEDGSLSNRRYYTDGKASPIYPDGICLDNAGGLWVSNLDKELGVYRILDGGKITHQVKVMDKLQSFACMIGGEGNNTLFICTSLNADAAVSDEQRSAGVETIDLEDFKHAGTP